MLIQILIFDVSEPKDRKSIIPKDFNILIEPSAKFSLLEIEYKTGSSIIKSTPFCNAISVFFHLSIIEVEPRCVKLPLIIATVYSAPVAFLDSFK